MEQNQSEESPEFSVVPGGPTFQLLRRLKLTASDIQSLADLANSYGVVREMNFVPFGIQEISRLILLAVAPLVPLLLTVLSPRELIERVVKIVF
jgi:hypothetical protein